MTSQDNSTFLVTVYDDEEKVMQAIPKIKEAGGKIFDVFSPFPIHGIDDLLGYKRSRLSVAAFMYGAVGLAIAVTLQTYTLGIDWPMIIGGKPFLALPDFVPVSFELTVLCTALGMVGTFFIVSNLKPGGQKVIFDPRVTDDRFVIAFNMDKNAQLGEEKLSAIAREHGALETYTKEAKPYTL